MREGVTEKLTDHVWAIPDGSASLVPNVGIIVGKKAVLVVDTGMGTRNAEAVQREVAKVGAGKPIYIVTTHVHPEHDMGAHAFPQDSKLIRSKSQVEDIAAGAGMNLVPLFASRSELNQQLLKDAKHRDADIVFDDDYTLDLGGLKAKIRAMGTNHTHGDTVVFVDGILFSGDVAMKPQPAFTNPTATITHWLESLDTLQAMKPKTDRAQPWTVRRCRNHRGIPQPTSRESAHAPPSSRRPARPRTRRSRSSRTRWSRSTRTRTGWRARSAQAIPKQS